LDWRDRLRGRGPRALGSAPRAFRYTSRPMQKQAWTWTTAHLPQAARMARWGHFGTPVVIFPTAGGDFEEIERFQLVAALGTLIDGGRIKVYSVDAVAARAWLAANTSPQECVGLQERYNSFLYEDVLQRVRLDCQNDRIEPILVGASLGAVAAVSTLCRHPESFRTAIGLSGVYDEVFGGVVGGSRVFGCACEFARGTGASRQDETGYLATLAGPQLERLRQRPIILGSGAGDYENPADSKHLADALGSKGIACRLDLWGPTRDHTWSTWRDMLPRLLAGAL
jgi:esterase/lipase superfamily enzyme